VAARQLFSRLPDETMIASAHIAAGAVAATIGGRLSGSAAGRAAAAFAIGVLSHVALDAVPHADYAPLQRATIVWVVLCESVVMAALVASIVRRRIARGWLPCLAAGVLGAVLPDAKFGAPLLLSAHAAERVRAYGDALHDYFHAPRPPTSLVGWVLEIGATLVLLAILTRFPRTADSPESSTVPARERDRHT
jgi:hypothetical protein